MSARLEIGFYHATTWMLSHNTLSLPDASLSRQFFFNATVQTICSLFVSLRSNQYIGRCLPNPHLFADADEGAIVETGRFAKLSTAGYMPTMVSGVQFSVKDPWCPQLIPIEFSYNW